VPWSEKRPWVIERPARAHYSDRSRDFWLHLRLASRRVSSWNFHQRRGNNRGNIIAMIVGFIVVAILSGLPNNIARIILGIADPYQYPLYPQPSWLPVMEFPWWICFGTIVTFSVAILFRTDREHHPPP
jgi:hypothetical protein